MMPQCSTSGLQWEDQLEFGALTSGSASTMREQPRRGQITQFEFIIPAWSISDTQWHLNEFSATTTPNTQQVKHIPQLV
eukprot:4918981-Amphidinium_carterae.1